MQRERTVHRVQRITSANLTFVVSEVLGSTQKAVKVKVISVGPKGYVM